MTLVGNVDLLGQTQDRVNAGVDSFGPAWDAASQEVAVKIAKTNAFLDALRVKIGEGLTSATGDAITGIGELGTAFDNLHKAMDPAYFASQQLDAAIRDEAKALGVDGDAIVEWMHHKDDASSATKALATDQAKLNDLLAHMPSVAESLGNPLAAIAWTNAVAALTDKIAAEKEATTAGAAAVIAYTTSQHTAAAADYYREKSQVDLNDRIQKMMGLLGISTKAIVDNAAVEAEAGAAYAVAASHMGDAAQRGPCRQQGGDRQLRDDGRGVRHQGQSQGDDLRDQERDGPGALGDQEPERLAGDSDDTREGSGQG